MDLKSTKNVHNPKRYQTDILGQLPSRTRKLFPHRILRELRRNQSIADHQVTLRKITRWKYRYYKRWKMTKRFCLEMVEKLNFWNGSFKTVESTFGSSVSSYFQFLKKLLLLNLLACVCVLTTIVLPQALVSPSEFSETLPNGYYTDYSVSSHKTALECTNAYKLSLKRNMDNPGSSITDFFQGTGFMEYTYLFIGFYFTKTTYNMPVGYILTTAIYFGLTLIFIIRYTGVNIRDKLLAKGNKYPSCSLVFCGWDHTLTQEKAAKYKHTSLFQELRRELHKKQRNNMWQRMKLIEKVRIHAIRVMVNIVTICILVSCGTLIYFTVHVWKPELEGKIDENTNNIVKLGIEFLPSITLTLLNLVFPFVFQKIIVVEKYAPGLELKITIVRTVLLRLASLVVLAITLLDLITCPGEDRLQCGHCGHIICWETYVGQELYKLVILDLFVILATTFVFDFPRQAIINKFPQLDIFRQEFDLPVNVLNIVYTQTLSWWGGFYSPLIPFITFAKLIICFYCKKLSLLKNQLPPSRPYRASKSNNFFMLILMVSFTLSALAIAYSIGKIPPSYSCSPFRIHSRPEYKMFHSVSDAISILPLALQEFLFFTTSWVFYVMLFVVLILCIYYYTANIASRKKIAELLKVKLCEVEADKRYYIKQVSDLAVKDSQSVED